jgi:hypothetical protein
MPSWAKEEALLGLLGTHLLGSLLSTEKTIDEADRPIHEWAL